MTRLCDLHNSFCKKIIADTLAGLLLVFGILGVYSPALQYDFLYIDDPQYVFGNEYVKNGITKKNLIWALKTPNCGNWHPVTMFSHMLDVELYGVNSAAHHLMNVLIHCVNAILLFLLLKTMTRSPLPSFFVAALFGLHPLHVESVAWISERKDVLSTMLGLLATRAYVEYAGTGRKKYYLFSAALYLLGLLAKPMLVTFPIVMLLIDFWPLQRMRFGQRNLEKELEGTAAGQQGHSIRHLVIEKIPFFTISLAFCVTTIWAQRSAGAVVSGAQIPMLLRYINAIISYASYLLKTFWPNGLSVCYPYPHSFDPVVLLASFTFLMATTICAVYFHKSSPWFAVGWLWYVGMLVPVIGLVQVGSQAMADRYTYMPLTGIFVALAYSLDRFFHKTGHYAAYWLLVIALFLGPCMLVAQKQLAYWRNTYTLFTHAVQVTKNNTRAHYKIGQWWLANNELDSARKHLEAAVAMEPVETSAYNDLGVTLARQGHIELAIPYFSKCLELDPAHKEARINLEKARDTPGIGQLGDGPHNAINIDALK
jgi:tetratricopeptide (TPR) repeat protein